MRRREEKKRKFNEAVINIIFPPSSSPQSQTDEDEDDDEQTSNLYYQHVSSPNLLSVSDDIEEGTVNGADEEEEEEDGEGQFGKQKLSRAQRKRLRKKKLKEESIRRGNMIGPLLPVDTHTHTQHDCGSGNKGLEGINGASVEESPCVRRNADEDAEKSEQGHDPAVNNKKKLKQRRMAKRLARDSLNSPTRQG